ncbi:hypothetical protein [Corynebacterium liangguodongii]|uniref:Uncharacterized protein n=1 Tax=Corynebacterium liangguodongii TaxID=2079535 RepID=A0A2S0WGH4_9CORY|nr:hypothetical protein [Corynebacterium liangguodongii]AWB84772.1 hypothetical protein C3E79_10055 [Corynebacterium liangguodongii]PWB99130.1 hypothetical protein DF219_07670 [Corynebacterium liangguodongii]
MSLIRTVGGVGGQWARQDFLRFYLVGADHATRWAFGAPDSPVRLATIPTGLQGAGFKHDYQEFVGIDGGLYRGTTDQRASITLKLWVADPRSSAWARRQHTLWRESLGRGKTPARLYVISKESGYWWVDVRPETIAEVDYMAESDVPGSVGEIGEVVTFTTDRSFWTRFDEIREFTPATGFTASLRNLGDQEAWLRWSITGAHNGVEIGIGDDTRLLPDPRTLRKYSDFLAGKDPIYGYLIDTDETWPTIMSTSGEDLQPLFPMVWWSKPLPPRGVERGKSTPLTISPKNPGPDFKVEVAYTPRTEQAW